MTTAETIADALVAALDEGMTTTLGTELYPERAIRAAISDLIDKGVIRPGLETPTERAADRQGYAQQRVAQIAAHAGHPAPDGWLVAYAWKDAQFGTRGYSLAAYSSQGRVWEAIRRINEREIAQHLQAAMQFERTIITP